MPTQSQQVDSLLVFFWLNGLDWSYWFDSSCLGLDWHTQLLQSLLCALNLLSFTFGFQRITSSFAGDAELVQSQLLWRFWFQEFEYSHAFIYGNG
jgi:hypothetical protein